MEISLRYFVFSKLAHFTYHAKFQVCNFCQFLNRLRTNKPTNKKVIRYQIMLNLPRWPTFVFKESLTATVEFQRTVKICSLYPEFVLTRFHCSWAVWHKHGNQNWRKSPYVGRWVESQGKNLTNLETHDWQSLLRELIRFQQHLCRCNH